MQVQFALFRKLTVDLNSSFRQRRAPRQHPPAPRALQTVKKIRAFVVWGNVHVTPEDVKTSALVI